MFAMNPLGRLFNRPRKSRSPARRALTEFLNSVTVPSEFQHQHQQHQHQHQKSYTFPPTNKQKSQLENSANANETSSSHVVTPMLITSSFYSREYPFDDNSSVEEAEEAIVDPIINTEPRSNYLDLSPPQQYLCNPQQQQIPETEIPPPYLQHQQSFSNQYPTTTATEYINIPQHQNSLYYEERENISYNDTFHPQTSQQPQQQITMDSTPPNYRPFKRIPTPYVYHSNHNEDYNLEQDYERDDRHYYHAEDISGFEQLKNDFKKLEKKHKRKEKRVQELEYLLFSRSYESTNNVKYYTTSPQSYVDTTTSSSYPYYSSDYYYGDNYGGDYYYANHTPSSYHQRYSSAGPSFSNISRHNINSNSNSDISGSHNHRYSLDNSFGMDNDDTMLRNYYIQQQQQRYYNIMRSNTNNNDVSSNNNKKRWTQ